MSYIHIDNLYKIAPEILMLKEVYCLEKIHGSSSWLNYSDKGIRFYAGGVPQEDFEALFHKEELLEKFAEMYSGFPITIYGEVYGGKRQKMSETYEKELRFVAFDVRVGNKWLNVPTADMIAKDFGLEFVYYTKTSTDLEALNIERDRDSVQAIRNGMGEGHPSEGIVIRPLIELTKNNGGRLIAKYKKEKFRETKSPRPINVEKLEILKNAQTIADEWVTEERLNHVANSLNLEIKPENIPHLIRGMFEDIKREAEGEIEWSKECDRSVGKATAMLIKEICKNRLTCT